MIPFSLAELAELTQGQLIGENMIIHHVSTDTRQVETDALFIALIGERFDGHDFCQQALEKGAAALLVSRKVTSARPQVVVKDTTIAMGQIARWVHQQSQALTLALTGSCGKTTVKEMLTAILKQKGQVLSTSGNFNNEIGVPLTLFRSQQEDDYAVIELGANHQGEIAYTTQLVQPDIALVNNVAAAHLEGFGSIEGVAKAKGEIFQGLPENGSAIINLDSHGLTFWQPCLNDKKVITFSVTDEKADYFADEIEVDHQGRAQFLLCTPVGHQKVILPLIGQHNISNALAACAMAMQAGAQLSEVVQGLQVATNVHGRVEVIELTDTIRLIDDSYNASVPAMKAAADLLSHYQGTRWLILGFMAELGEKSQQLHREVGEHIVQFNFDYVLTFGEDTAIIHQVCQNRPNMHAQHFETHESMIHFIKQHLPPTTGSNTESHTLLVKGANSSKMITIVEALKENYL